MKYFIAYGCDIKQIYRAKIVEFNSLANAAILAIDLRSQLLINELQLIPKIEDYIQELNLSPEDAEIRRADDLYEEGPYFVQEFNPHNIYHVRAMKNRNKVKTPYYIELTEEEFYRLKGAK